MSRTKKLLMLKYTLYTLLILLLYIVQTTPGLFAIAGIKPLLVVPPALAIAMYEKELAGGLYGALAGILCDASSSSLFGFNGFFIALFCMAAGLLVTYLLHRNLLNCLFFTGATLLVRGSVEFLFAYGMWGHESVWKLFAFYTLPALLYTLAVTAPIYWLVRYMYRRFEEAIHP